MKNIIFTLILISALGSTFAPALLSADQDQTKPIARIYDQLEPLINDLELTHHYAILQYRLGIFEEFAGIDKADWILRYFKENERILKLSIKSRQQIFMTLIGFPSKSIVDLLDLYSNNKNPNYFEQKHNKEISHFKSWLIENGLINPEENEIISEVNDTVC